MTKSGVILIVSFVMVFLAGVAGGFVVLRSAPPPPRQPWLSRELGLNAKQQEQMRAIWSQDRDHMGQSFEQMRAVREWRDKAIQELLTEDQKAHYDQIVKEADQKMAAITAERRKGFEEKAARTREILNEEQRKKFDALQKEFVPGGPPFGGGPGHGRRRPPEGGHPESSGAGGQQAP